MKISEITAETVAEYLRLDPDAAYDPLLPPIMASTKALISSFTGLTDEEIDEHDDFWQAYMSLVQNAYDNRTPYVDKNSVGFVFDAILNQHRVNFL